MIELFLEHKKEAKILLVVALGFVMENIQALKCPQDNPVSGSACSQRRTPNCPFHAICGCHLYIFN